MEALDIVKDGATAAGFAKILVDVVKIMPIPSPSVVLPILALILAEGCAFLLFMAGAGEVNRQSMSVTVLVGIVATGAAIAATSLQTKADKVDEKIEVALMMKPGSTKEDVDKVVHGTGDGK